MFSLVSFSNSYKLQFILINDSDFRLSIYCSGVIPEKQMKLSSKSQLGFVYGRLLILYSELWDHNLFKKMWKFTRNVRLHEQNKYRATSGVGSKKNLNRFHLGFAWTFYMIKAVRLSNNSRASDGFFFNRNFLDLKLLLLPNIR